MPELVERDLVLDGLRFHLVDRGRPGDPAVLLLHGFNQTARSWDEFAERIAADGFRAVAIDQRGHGDSDRAPGGDYSRESMADEASSRRWPGCRGRASTTRSTPCIGSTRGGAWTTSARG